MFKFTPQKIENVFTPSECEKIIEICKEYELTPGTTYSAADGSEIVNPDARIAEDVRPPINENTKWFIDRTWGAILEANEHFEFDLSEIKPLEWAFVKYPVGGHFARHTDTTGVGEIRKLTCSIELCSADSYDGGDLLIQGSMGKAKNQGMATIFPSFLPHVATRINRGVRYALIVWAHGDRTFR